MKNALGTRPGGGYKAYRIYREYRIYGIYRPYRASLNIENTGEPPHGKVFLY